MHLQIDDSTVETLAAKRAFEAFAAEHGVCIQHYHCENERFFDNAFRQACHSSRQSLTFCGVNANIQNEIAERAIRDLSESAQKQLLHARARWPAAVHFALWPYALRHAALLHNSLPVLKDGTSRLELFSSIWVGVHMKNVKEVNGHIKNNHWALVTRDTVPDDAQIVPSVWSMRRKQDLTTNKVKSHKA